MDPTSNIGRWVTFLLGPLSVLAAGLISHAALAVFGIHLDPTATAAWSLTAMIGATGLIYKWLHNRGVQELAHATGTSPQRIDEIATLVIDRMPKAPEAAAPPGDGTPAEPRAPGAPKH